MAVDRETSSKMVAKSFKTRDSDKTSGADKRNLHLAKEGFIAEGSAAATGVSESDMQKRQQADADKKKKLADSNFFVSTTRLSVRNLPVTVEDRTLKEIFLKASKGPDKLILNIK